MPEASQFPPTPDSNLPTPLEDGLAARNFSADLQSARTSALSIAGAVAASALPAGPSATATNIHIEKFRKFEAQVLVSSAADLAALDPTASVHLAGSYIHAPASLRPGSDIDMMVYSTALKEPQAYFDFLKKLEERAWQFKASTGLQPVFFTQQVNEFSSCDKARSAFLKQQCEVIPCHFLYYKDVHEILEREPLSLARGLMKNARSLLGNPPVFNQSSNHTFPALEHASMLRWNVERASADMILNHRLLPEPFVVYRFADTMFSCLRIYATLTLPFEDQSVPELLESFDPGDAHNLADQFKPLIAIRQGEPGDARGDLETLIKPAQTLLTIIDQKFRSSQIMH